MANTHPTAAAAPTIHQWRRLAGGCFAGCCSSGGGGGSWSGPFQAEEPRLFVAAAAIGSLSDFPAAAAAAWAGFPSLPAAAGGLLSAFAGVIAAGGGDLDDGGPPTNRGLGGADVAGVGVADADVAGVGVVDVGLWAAAGFAGDATEAAGDERGGVLPGGVLAGCGCGAWLRGGASESSSSTASNAELSTVWLIAGTLPTTSVAVARSCFACETSLQLGGGLIITIPPHFGQARICPTAAGSRTFSRDLQVVQVRVKRSMWGANE